MEQPMEHQQHVEPAFWTGSAMTDQMLNSFVLWSCGDILSQLMTYCTSRAHKNHRFTYLPLQTLRLALFASCVWAPATWHWFTLLETLIPGDNYNSALKRMLADQLLYAPCVIFALFVVIGLMEGLNCRKIGDKLRHNYVSTLMRNWMVWPLAQFIIQGYVSLQFRIVCANIINLPWTAFLAYRAAQSNHVLPVPNTASWQKLPPNAEVEENDDASIGGELN